MNCIQVCLVLAASCSMLASAKPSSYNLAYNANDNEDQGTVELDAPSMELAKDCDPLTSDYLVTGSTPAPLLRTAVDIEPARIMSVTASPIHSEFVSMSTPSPLLRTAVDVEPARIITMSTPSPLLRTAVDVEPARIITMSTPAPLLRTKVDVEPARIITMSTPAPLLRTAVEIEPARIVAAAPLKFETRNAARPLLSAFRPVIRSLAPKRPLVESKIAMSVQHSAPIATRILSAPSLSTSYSYAAPQYYSAPAAYAPQYYSAPAAYAPQYYSAPAAFAPQYNQSPAAFAPQYYSSLPIAADEPCDK